MLYRIERDWYALIDRVNRGNAIPPTRARKQLRDAIILIAPIFSQKPFFLSDEFSLVDCAIIPVLWRLPHYGIELPRRPKRLAIMPSAYSRAKPCDQACWRVKRKCVRRHARIIERVKLHCANTSFTSVLITCCQQVLRHVHDIESPVPHSRPCTSGSSKTNLSPYVLGIPRPPASRFRKNILLTTRLFSTSVARGKGVASRQRRG